MHLVNIRFDRKAKVSPVRLRTHLRAWFCFALLLTAIAPAPVKASFSGDYALANFTLINTKLNAADLVEPDGFAGITPEGWLVLTGSNTGSGLFPGATTDVTISSRGTGQVAFDWLYSSLDDPTNDIGGYLSGGSFEALADADGQSGSVTFQVTLGETFGFRLRTLDNIFEPGVLTIRNFTAPSSLTIVPEPGALILVPIALACGILARRRRVR